MFTFGQLLLEPNFPKSNETKLKGLWMQKQRNKMDAIVLQFGN